MKALQKLFAPKEVRDALKALDEARANYLQNARGDQKQHASEAFGRIGRLVENQIFEEKAKVAGAIGDDGWSPRQLAASLLLATSQGMLMSGVFHVGRALRGIRGDGGRTLDRGHISENVGGFLEQPYGRHEKGPFPRIGERHSRPSFCTLHSAFCIFTSPPAVP